MTTDSESALQSLPYSCMWPIFERLDLSSLRETRQVSKFFRMLSDADRVWQRHTIPLLKRDMASVTLPTSGFRLIFYQKLKWWSLTTLTEGLVSHHDQLISKPALLNWGTAVVDFPRIRKKAQYCEFIIEEALEGYLSDTHKIVIGVVPENFEVTLGHCVGDGHSFGYAAQSGHKVGGGGSEPQSYGISYGNGDRVGVLANPTSNEISFFLNGVSLGVAFAGAMDTESRTYQFAVSLVRSHMRVRIVTSAKMPPLAQQGLEGGSSTTTLEKAHSVRDDPVVRELELYHDLRVTHFPLEVLQQVFSYLSVHSLLDVRLVRPEWAHVAASDYIWRSVAKSLTPYPELLLHSTGSDTYKAAYIRNAMRFSETVQAPGLELSNDRTTVTSSSRVTYWAAIRLEHPAMQSGVHYAEFKIDVFRHGTIGNTWKVVCGVVSEEFEYTLTKWVGVDSRSFGFIAANGKAVGPLAKNLGTPYADGYQENDRIGVLVDFPADQIFFYKNGVNLGVAFDGFTKQAKLNDPDSKYYFAVSLARFGMQITVIPNAKCPDRDIIASF